MLPRQLSSAQIDNPQTDQNIMKRFCAIATMALLTGGLFAQHAVTNFPQLEPLQHKPHPTTPTAPLNGGQRDVVFTEDFANGFAGNNGVGAWTFSGTNGDVWRYTTTGPVGAFTVLSEIITSPSASNGFMLFNSDSVNTDFNATPPVEVSPRIPLTGSLVSPVLDLSASPSVEIRFYQKYRFCCASNSGHTLDVSTDGGTTWPTSISLDMGVAQNDEFSTAETSVNIAGAISANPSNVRLRFNQGGTNVSAYYWQIDDISIASLPGNELIMDYGFTSQFGAGYEYGRVPASQLGSSIDVGAGIINYGGNTQNNVTLNISLKDASNTEVSNTSVNLGSILSGDTVHVETDLTIPSPMSLGLYTAYFTMTSDSIAVDLDPANNAKQRRFSVTDDLYSLDGVGGVNPAAEQSITRAGTGSFTDNTQDVRVLNYFVVTAQEVFDGVEIVTATQSQAGSYFIGAIYDTTEMFAGTSLSSPIAETEIRVIVASDLTGSRRAAVDFLDPVTLAPGAYYVAARLYQEAAKNLYVVDDLTVPQPGDASMLWLPVDDQNQYLYGNGNAWAVRLYKNGPAGVQEHSSLEGITTYPSPTTGLVQIRSEKAASMTVEVFNTLGKVVATTSFNGTATTLDLTGNAAGIYTVRVSDGTNYNVQRITLK